MPRRDRKRQKDFILHQLGHIQFACHRQEIPCIVLQIVLRQFAAFGNQLQNAIDVEFETNGTQATLTGQRKSPVCFNMQHGLSALSPVPLEPKINLSGNLRQQIMQALQVDNSQRSFQNASITGKRETIRNLFQS